MTDSIPENIPAITSSKTIPNPFLYSLSKKEIGYGLRISKNLNNIKAIAA